jgi:energy-coupling factor transporter ATP-binding protein EcfA2
VRLEASDFVGRVTFITGPSKHCGKTTLLNACLALLRAAGERPAFLGVGFDGEGRDSLSGVRKPRIAIEPGEVFVTAERYLSSSGCLPEILDVLPGSTALGRLAVARARRSGAVTLVGPERNEYAAGAISMILGEGWAGTVLVDGAINRITQVSSFEGARFLFSLRVSPQDVEAQVRRIRLLYALHSLPVLRRAEGEGARDQAEAFPEPLFCLHGPLTEETAKRIPPEAATVVVEDFTKVFLDGPGLSAFTRQRGLALRSKADFGGFVVVLRDLTRGKFSAALKDRDIEEMVSYNPYEGLSGGAA